MEINFNGTVIVWQDFHYPYHDPRVIREAELFAYDLQPDMILYPGDIIDCYLLSKFDKNPKRSGGKGSLQKEFDMAAAMFKRHRKYCPNARMIFEPGNHEDRLRRYLWSKATELEDLRCMQIESLMGLTDNGVELIEKDEGVLFNGNFLVTHAEIVRAHSGYTAKGMMDKHGGSGIHGHSHRLGSHYKTPRSGMQGWFENGCLGNMNPDYMVHPNWQQGFSVVTFINGRFWVEQLPIINRKFIYGGTVYGSGGKKRKNKV